jgi:hypothetical protein
MFLAQRHLHALPPVRSAHCIHIDHPFWPEIAEDSAQEWIATTSQYPLKTLDLDQKGWKRDLGEQP